MAKISKRPSRASQNEKVDRRPGVDDFFSRNTGFGLAREEEEYRAARYGRWVDRSPFARRAYTPDEEAED